MMKLLFFMFFSYLLFIDCNFGQSKFSEEKLYLLLTSSKDHISSWESDEVNKVESDSTIPSILFLLENQNLKLIDTINFYPKIGSIMPECRHFEKFGFFYIRENRIKGSWVSDKSGKYYDLNEYEDLISILDYSTDTIYIRKAVADSILSGCFNLHGASYYKWDGTLQYTFSQCDNQKIYNRNVINKDLLIEEIQEQTFLNGLYCLSEASFFFRHQGGYPFNRNGNLVMSFNGENDIKDWRKIDFQFPYAVDVEKYSCIVHLLKYPTFNKEVFFKRLYDGSTDSIITYYIYDRLTAELDSISTTFYIYSMNIYNDIVGYGTLALNPSFNRNLQKDLPNNSRYNKKYGVTPNLQFHTGSFYLWNLQTNDFTVFSFNDIDTELLSIHDDWVYFRLFDEIRRIRLDDLYLTDYQKNTELLYKDKDRVPHIHHVFWAPEMPLKVEWKTGNPYTKTSEK